VDKFVTSKLYEKSFHSDWTKKWMWSGCFYAPTPLELSGGQAITVIPFDNDSGFFSFFFLSFSDFL
jgi:hypothetical protein